MDFLNWYDWITPTHPYASLFFGILFTLIIGIIAWFSTKEFKSTVIGMITGVVVVGIVTGVLNVAGFYG